MKSALYVVGALLELFGLVLLAAPDLIPGLLRFVDWIRRTWIIVSPRLRRALHLRARDVVVHVTASDAALAMAEVAAVTKLLNPSATDSEKVAFLVQRDAEAQRDINDLNQRLEALRRAQERGTIDLRDEVKTYVERRLLELERDFRGVRIAGTVLLVVGLALTTSGNFIS